MKLSRFILPSLCIVMSSCVYSLFPIYTEDTIVYYPELNGKWTNEEAGFIQLEPAPVKTEFMANFQVGEKQKEKKRKIEKKPNSYKMTVSENEETFTYSVHLVKIGKETFMDLYPLLSDEILGSLLINNMFPVHTFIKLELDKDKMTLSQFQLSKLKDMFKSNRIRMRHEIVNDEVMITAQPKEIQKFLEKYAKDSEVFEKPDKYIRSI